MRWMSGRSRDPLVRALVSALDAKRVQVGDGARRLYSRDASMIRGGQAGVICFPETTEEVSACVVAALAHGRDFVARGAGTGLAGGAVPCDEDVIDYSKRAGFTVEETDYLTPHYVRTLNTWATALEAHRDEAIAVTSVEVYDRYMRYLVGCADFFERGISEVAQFTLVKN